jgi:hypothetical protein
MTNSGSYIDKITSFSSELSDNPDQKLEETNRTYNHDSIYLEAQWEEVKALLVTQETEIEEFIEEFKKGEWDSKGDPLDYFDSIIAFQELSTRLGSMRSAVESLVESRKEQLEAKDDYTESIKPRSEE